MSIKNSDSSIILTSLCSDNASVKFVDCVFIAFTCYHLDLMTHSFDRSLDVPSCYSDHIYSTVFEVYLPFEDRI